jgi:hypothetical protein
MHFNVEVDGRVSPLSLFALSIAKSGDRKTAVDNLAIKPVTQFEQGQLEAYEADKAIYKKDLAAYQEAKKAIKSEVKGESDQAEIRRAFDKLGPPPEPPIYPLLTVSNLTLEGLLKHYRQALPVVGIFTSEGGAFFGGHAMNSDNMLKTISTFSQLWDGAAVDMMRASDEVGSFKLYGRRASMHLMLQPAVYESLQAKDLQTQQGFLPRCLMAAPSSLMGERFYDPHDVTRRP